MNETIDILVKLFDTLKEASDETKKTSKELIAQQQELVNHVKHLPIAELKDALKEHAKESSQDIDSCTETVETKTDTILEKVKGIENKVGRMILVVIVAFSILTGGYIIIRTLSETSGDTHDAEIHVIKKEVDEIKEMIEKLHNKK